MLEFIVIATRNKFCFQITGEKKLKVQSPWSKEGVMSSVLMSRWLRSSSTQKINFYSLNKVKNIFRQCKRHPSTDHKNVLMAQIGCYDNQILTPNCEKSVTHGKND